MALQLKTVKAAQGLRWISQGLRLFVSKPLAFLSLFVLFLVVSLVFSLVPFLGAYLQMALLPLLSLGFLLATQALQQGQRVHPSQFVRPLRGSPDKRRDLVILCLAYGALAVGILVLANHVSNDAWFRLQVLLTKGRSAQPQVAALLQEPGVLTGAVLATALGSVLSVPFWHAPALVHFHGQSWPQALFSSSLALWRNRGAFLAYALGWCLLFGALVLVSGLVLGLLGVPQLMGLLGVPMGLVSSTAFYVSMQSCYQDSFGDDSTPEPPEPPEPPAPETA
jgi:hypothetical protein